MPEQREQPRPHGDPMEDLMNVNPEENRAQRQSDAPPDAAGGESREEGERSDRVGGRGSSANGVPPFDEDDGDLRRKQSENGADLVSGID